MDSKERFWQQTKPIKPKLVDDLRPFGEVPLFMKGSWTPEVSTLDRALKEGGDNVAEKICSYAASLDPVAYEGFLREVAVCEDKLKKDKRDLMLSPKYVRDIALHIILQIAAGAVGAAAGNKIGTLVWSLIAGKMASKTSDAFASSSLELVGDLDTMLTNIKTLRKKMDNKT